jgi:hypothetical protein
MIPRRNLAGQVMTMRIKAQPATKILSPAELALLTDAQLQKEYDRLMGEWMVRSNSGQRQTWRQFNEMDAYFLEMQRRKYGSGAVAEAKAELSNMRRMSLPKGEN